MLLCTSDETAFPCDLQRWTGLPWLLSVLGTLTRGTEPGQINWSWGRDCLQRPFTCCAEDGGGASSYNLLSPPLKSILSHPVLQRNWREISLLFFRSSVPAVPPTLLHYLVMARWSLSVSALTVTCSMSLLSIVTELVSDMLNYWCVFWSLTRTDTFDLRLRLERGTQWGHIGFDIHYYTFCTDSFYCILLSC